MDMLHTETVDKLFRAILSLKTIDECYALFIDLCTVNEIIDMAQRFDAADRLNRGENYAYITEKTGMSTATIARVRKCLLYGEGGYKLALSRLAAANDQKSEQKNSTKSVNTDDNNKNVRNSKGDGE
ncbi:MAG: YerC/YecD family TrpR-related protein [Eubacteriales bacterium]|jgi:TrpR-related protein YerC/YecD|nr:TrpR YerC/YecD [Clostridiales bacterium]